MNLLAEGIRSSVLPCSYSILLPAVALVVLRRSERIGVLWVYAGFTVVSAWIRAAGLSTVLAERGASLLLVLGGLGLALLVDHRPAGLGAAALLGLLSGATWFPCVGEELGEVLTDAPDAPAIALARLAIYLMGVMIPLVITTAVLAYVPIVRRFADTRGMAMAARAALATVAILVVTDNYGWLLSTLARWSVI